MAIDRGALEELPREELVVEARRVGVKRPEVMTRVELVDEVVRLGTPNPVERKKARGWLGVARDLLASAVEQGLNLPDAAAFIRGDVRFEPLRTPHRPVATVTLAEIYGTQGHFARAIAILDEVLAKEPEHHVARALREKIDRERTEKKGDAPRVPPDPVEEPDLTSDAPEAANAPEGANMPSVSSLPSVSEVIDASDASDPVTLRPPPKVGVPSVPEVIAASDVPDAVTLRPPPKVAAPAHTNGVTPRRAEHVLVLVRREPSRLVAYYERASDAAEHAPPAVIRVVEMRPRSSGAERVERELLANGASGAVPIDGVEPGSIVRAALGTKRGVHFRALAVAAEVRLGEGGPEILWAPRRVAPSAALLEKALARLPSSSS